MDKQSFQHDMELLQQLIQQVTDLRNSTDNEIRKGFFQKELDKLIQIQNDFQKLIK